MELPFIKRIFKKKVTKQEAREIKELCIRDTVLHDLSFLHNFPKLENLEITDTKLGSFEGIQYCSALKYFGYFTYRENMSYGISDVSFLQDLSELEHIIVDRNKIEDVSVSANLHKVTHLTLDYNPIDTIAPLKNMRSLEELYVVDCGLSSLELDEFPSLKTVVAAGNLFTDEQKREYQEKYPHIKIEFGEVDYEKA